MLYQQTSVFDTLDGSINEGCCSSIRIQVNHIYAVAFFAVVVHQCTVDSVKHERSKRNLKTHLASPSLTLTLPSFGFDGVDFSTTSVPSVEILTCCSPSSLISIFLRIAAVADDDRSLAMTYLKSDELELFLELTTRGSLQT